MNHEGHEEQNEGHEADMDDRLAPRGLRVMSPLSARAEEAMERTIGCAIRVHSALGPGFLESIYRKAMHVELRQTALSYESERPVTVRYREVDLSGQRVDLIVEGLIVVELKSVAKLDDVHRSQLISYLRTTELRGGLLINFRVALLKHGLRRVVL